MTSATWATATARRIGVGGAIDFTNSRCGVTLHLPCRGWGKAHPPHIVDVLIPPGQNPEAVAKKLMREGWSVGSRLKCPNKPTKEKRKDDSVDKETRAIGMGGASSRAIAAAAPLQQLANDPDEIVGVLVVEVSPEKQEEPSPSQAAGRARRLVYMALEDYYDEGKKAYKPGHSDAITAKECNVSEELVRKIREESYGPLAEPSEIAGFRAELAAAKEALDQTARTAHAQVKVAADAYCKAIESVERRLSVMAKKNGWNDDGL